ncbi:MAG: hypothetical protein Q4D58_07260 [Synergistaceae bacterium]|nr:hypothetical protein [Synergistaceae bacterium]
MKTLIRLIFIVFSLFAFPESVHCGEIRDPLDSELSARINAAAGGAVETTFTEEIGKRWKERLDRAYRSLHDSLHGDVKSCLERSQSEWVKMKEEDEEFFPNFHISDKRAVLYEARRRCASFRLRALMLEDAAGNGALRFTGSDIYRYDGMGRRGPNIMDEWFVELYNDAPNDTQKLKLLAMAKDAWNKRWRHANFYMMERLVKEKMRSARIDALAMEFPGLNAYLRIPEPIDGFYRHTVKNRERFLSAETKFWRSAYGELASAWQSLRLERQLALEIEECAFTGVPRKERQRKMYQFKKSDAYIYGKLRNNIFDREGGDGQ